MLRINIVLVCTLVVIIMQVVVRYAFSSALHPCLSALNDQYLPSSTTQANINHFGWLVMDVGRLKMHTALQKHVIVLILHFVFPHCALGWKLSPLFELLTWWGNTGRPAILLIGSTNFTSFGAKEVS